MGFDLFQRHSPGQTLHTGFRRSDAAEQQQSHSCTDQKVLNPAQPLHPGTLPIVDSVRFWLSCPPLFSQQGH